MSDSTNTNEYKLPPTTTESREFLLELHRGISQEIAGAIQLLQGKRQLLNAIERRLGKDKRS